MSRKALTIASLSTIVCIAAAGAQAQETFKGSKFLTYPAESQKSFINSAVIMAGLIATQNAEAQSRCINDWSVQHADAGYAPVMEAMRKYPDYHPTGVIISVLQKACGSFKYKN